MREARARLAAAGIHWHRTRYHKRPSLPATALDALWGVARALPIVLRHDLRIIHARSHIPAATALVVSRLTRAELVFDVRGLLADEYVDAGNWRRGGLAARVTEAVQRRATRRAGGIVVLTTGARRALLGGLDHPNLEVIPCCVDVQAFAAAAHRRAEVRAELGLGERPVVAYVGKFGGWYAEREMVEFFAVARRAIPGLHFLVLTQGDQALIDAEFRRAGIEAHDFTVRSVGPELVPELLAAADFGLSFVRPLPSKVASSPTKNGEYLAAGLPFVASAGVGGTDDIAAQTDAIVLIDGFDEQEYERAAGRISRLLAEPGIRERCSGVASRLLSLQGSGIPRYLRLYERIGEAADPRSRRGPRVSRRSAGGA